MPPLPSVVSASPADPGCAEQTHGQRGHGRVTVSGHEGRSPEPRRWPIWPKGQVSRRGSQGGTAAPLRELGSGPWAFPGWDPGGGGDSWRAPLPIGTWVPCLARGSHPSEGGNSESPEEPQVLRLRPDACLPVPRPGSPFPVNLPRPPPGLWVSPDRRGFGQKRQLSKQPPRDRNLFC